MEITLKLKLDMVNVIMAALGDAPFKISEPVINEIKLQAAPQLQAAQAASETPAQAA
jgi:hypothetical protein